MKRFLTLLLAMVITALAAPMAGAESSAQPEISAKSAILMHAETGTILFERNIDEHMLIASTTKLMTALVVLDNCDTSEKVTVSRECTLVEGSSMYLRAGEQYTVEELLYGLMLVSGNDAALTLAEHVGGGIEGFAAMMNAKARELGLNGSSFKNPHGLDEDGHYSTARDLAVIMAAAMKNEAFVEIASSRAHNVGELTYVNHNKLLWNYQGTLAGKTGYTQAAGRSLVSCAERNGLRLICVTLNDPDDWDDHAALYDWGFNNYVYRSVMAPGEFTRLPVISGVKDTVGIAPEEDAKLLLNRGDTPTAQIELPRFVFAGVQAGERAGTVTVSRDGEVLLQIGLCYSESVALDKAVKLTSWEKFKRAWYMANRYGPINYGYYA